MHAMRMPLFLNNILLGKAYDYSNNEKLPIEVLLGNAINNTYGEYAWEWTDIGPFYYGEGENEKRLYPKFLTKRWEMPSEPPSSLYAIKSFNEERYNKFLDLMKEKGVKF